MASRGRTELPACVSCRKRPGTLPLQFSALNLRKETISRVTIELSSNIQHF